MDKEWKLLGDLIRDAREARGMTRVKLAEFVGSTPNSVARFELAGRPEGKYPPSVKLVKICDVLEIDPRVAFDMVKREESFQRQQEWQKQNPGKEVPADVIYQGIQFRHHFNSKMDWLDQSLSIKTIQDINESHSHIQMALWSIEEKLANLEFSQTKNDPNQEGPGRSNKPTNQEAVDATSINQDPKGEPN